MILNSSLTVVRASLTPLLLGLSLTVPLIAAAQAPMLPNAAQPVATSRVAMPAANSLAEHFQRLVSDRWVSRTVSFAELGFNKPLVLGGPDSQREIYLPVPPNVAIDSGELKFDASYLRADGGRTTLVMSLDSYPVSARPMPLDKGDASIVLGVDGAPRPTGYVRLGLQWGTALGAEWLCTDARTIGNLLRIEPTSRFSYHYDGSQVRDLATAWAALPAVPGILVSGNNLSTESYESALRMGLALERAGKRSQIIALPMVGETIELGEANVPAALLNVPAFAAVAHSGSHKLATPAELGALLSLGAAGPLHADKALAANVTAALDALRGELQASAPAAVESFDAWRAAAFNRLLRPLVSHQIELVSVSGSPVIVIAADAGTQAAALFTSEWTRMAVSPLLIVQAADEPNTEASAISLKALGGKPGSFDVLSRADWTASFDIGLAALDGRVPSELVVDVAASPSGALSPPVASLFLNDILLGARQMKADGLRERITGDIPRYALAARNTLRVSFVRQLASDRCRETPEAYPVSVLPSSHVLLKKGDPGNDFSGMAARYASGAHVMVPAAYLADSSRTLPRVIRLAATTGISPQKARFTAVSGGETPVPGGSFLAIELPFKDAKSEVTIDAGHVQLVNHKNRPLLDLAGLNQAGILEVQKVGGDHGISYRNIGSEPPTMTQPLLLAAGNVAVLGNDKVLAETDTAHPDRRLKADHDEQWPMSLSYWWMLPVLLIVFMLSLLVLASRTRRRNQNTTRL